MTSHSSAVSETPRRRAAKSAPARWTPVRQQRFLAALMAGATVAAAARGVGMSRQGAYRFRARASACPGAASFAAAWDAARRHAEAERFRHVEAYAPRVPADAAGRIRALTDGEVLRRLRRNPYRAL
ncbi:MAG: hypothetical protein AAF205_12360 [Pseudomonadota bacterium]